MAAVEEAKAVEEAMEMAAVEEEAARAAAAVGRPVSYTHLTLPTIYSV